MSPPRWLILLSSVFVVGVLTVGIGVGGAMRPPAVIAYSIEDPRWPAGAPPLRVVQLSDIHANEPFMTATRLRDIVARTNALRPDIVVLTGDYVGDTTLGGTPLGAEEAVQPLGALRPRLGVYAVLGNHDHWFDAGGIAAALRRAGIVVLDNEHVRAGPITVAGVDDAFTGHADLGRALQELDQGGPTILLSHSPDLFPDVDKRVMLTLAGHTHGGQIVLPVVGPLATASRFGRRYAHGHDIEDKRHLIVSAGLGTSLLPMRIGMPPEITMITLR